MLKNLKNLEISIFFKISLYTNYYKLFVIVYGYLDNCCTYKHVLT